MLNKDEFEKASKLLKRNKASGYDDLDVNIITILYELIKKLSLKIFNESINLDILSENMKVAKVTPTFKSGKKITNKLSANFCTFVFLQIYGEDNVQPSL